MELSKRHARSLTTWLIASVLTVGAASLAHAVEPLRADAIESCRAVPKCCKDHVYIFLVNGLDPVNYGNLTGLRDHIQKLGFRQTYYGQLYNYWWFKGEIKKIRQQDPQAHFVLIGFSLGVNEVHSMARGVGEDGIAVDLMVFLSGNHPVKHMPNFKPNNVARVVNILASGLMQSRGERSWAENLRLPDTHHFDSPMHPQTQQVMAMELAAIASTVPVVAIPEPSMPPVPDEPTPRPMQREPSARRDAWDFLKPVSNLRMPREGEGEKEQKPVTPNPERIAAR